LTEVGTVGCYDCEGIGEGEKVTFDETVSGEYLMDGRDGNETKEEKCKKTEGNRPVSLIEWVRPIAVDELGQLESVLYGSRGREQLP